MIKFQWWKIVFIYATCLIGLVVALPNALTPDQRDALPSWFPKKTVNLGLDLQGGSHLVLEVDLDTAIRRSYDNLEDEVRSLLRKEGFHYRDMLSKGINGISFLAFKPDEVAAIKTLLGTNLREAQISEENGTFSIALTPERLTEMQVHAVDQTLEILRMRVDEFGVAEPVIQREGVNRVIIELPGIEDPARAKGIIGRTAQLNFHMVDESTSVEEALRVGAPAGSAIFYEQAPEGQELPIVLRKRPAISGENLAQARSGFDQHGSPAVNITFDNRGTLKFADLTRENVGKRMAIVLDGVVYSAPVLREPILGGSAEITGSFTVKEAEDLAMVLRSGALPAPVKIVEERTVGPSLGQDSIEAGTTAVILGFVFVLVIMAIFYRGFGMAANVALFFNLVLIVAAMTLIGATLTLPGLAGMVLTLGMAVDANVLVFERIREETRRGRSPMMAIDAGYKTAFMTILDSNLTTLITAFVMFYLGSGPIRGFALTLSVGLVISMFTALMLTRYLMVLWLKSAKPKQLAA